MKRLSIIGGGSWGRALSFIFSNYYDKVHLWCYNQSELNKLPLAIKQKSNIDANFELNLITNSDAVLVAVPSIGFIQIIKNIKPYLHKQHIAWASKGFEAQSGQLLHNCFSQILPDIIPTLISGPSFAVEVLAEKPTALVVSSTSEAMQNYWTKALQKSNHIRAYKNNDIIGAQVGGAVKNILAIAAGIVAGLDYGANTQAALITRGLAEMMRLGLAMGAKRETFMGLTGLGDLVLSCSNDLSRNRQFGGYLVKYSDIDKAKQNINSTIEGLKSLKNTLKFAQKYHIEMPICEQIYQVIYQQKSPQNAISTLMQREITNE